MAELEPKTDEELLEGARDAPEGDMRDFEALVQRFKGRVVTNCRYITRQPAEAEDLAQEVFLKIFFGMDRFEGRSAVRTWIQRIKVNHCLNHLKKNQGRTHVDIDDPALLGEEELAVPADVDRGLRREDDQARISAVLDGLTDTLRVPLIMRDMDQLSYQEIAETLNIGLSAVKMRIKRAREEFRVRFDELARDEGRESASA